MRYCFVAYRNLMRDPEMVSFTGCYPPVRGADMGYQFVPNLVQAVHENCLVPSTWFLHKLDESKSTSSSFLIFDISVTVHGNTNGHLE